MLKARNFPLPQLAASLAALRVRMAAHPMRGALMLGVTVGAINFLIFVPLALAAVALFTSQQLGGTAAASLKDASTATILWIAVVWAPLFETLIGQWLPLEILRRYKVRTAVSLLASAVLFSLLHVVNGAGILHAAITFIGGCTFAASYLTARSMGLAPAYVAAAAAHACSNGLLLCLSLLFPGLAS